MRNKLVLLGVEGIHNLWVGPKRAPRLMDPGFGFVFRVIPFCKLRVQDYAI